MRRGGNLATDQAPMTCRPYAAQSVVTGGLGAHTRSLRPSPRGGVADRAESGASAPPRPPIRAPRGFQQHVRRECVHVVWARG